MNEPETDVATCPYLRPITNGLGDASPYAVYCRQPRGTVRVPSRDERERFCASGHHLDCPGYRRAHLRETFLTGLA
jgi:hypothetical protein